MPSGGNGFKDMTGRRFGRLLVVERAGSNKRGHARWLCICECGGSAIATGHHLRNGHTRSCGCLVVEQALKASKLGGLATRKPIPRERFKHLYEISVDEQRLWLSDLPMNTRISGIYMIVNEISGKLYIGSSADCQTRWRDHQHRLRTGKRLDNQHLQSAWNLYGESAFRFEIVEIVSDTQKLVEREQAWIDKYPWGRLYNLRPKAESGRGLKASAETRAKMSRARKGKPKSAEWAAKIGASGKGKHFKPQGEYYARRRTWNEARRRIAAEMYENGMSRSEVAVTLGVSYAVASRDLLASGKRDRYHSHFIGPLLN